MSTNADKNDFDETMTIGELIDELVKFPMGSKVVFLDNYGDRVNTIQCLYVRKVETRVMSDFKKTAYSDTGVALKNPERVYDAEYEDTAGRDVSIVTIAPYDY